MPGNLTLFQSEETQYCYPVPDKIVKIEYALFQNVRHSLLSKSEMVCLSKHEAEPKQNSNSVCFQRDSGRKKVTLTPNVFQSRDWQKVYPVPDTDLGVENGKIRDSPRLLFENQNLRL